MIQKTYTARINRVRSMVSGLTTYLEQLEKHGASPEFLAALSLFKGNLHQIQEYRRTLKKDSLEATAAKNCNLKEAEHLCSRARKWVRREFPAEVWPQFGFRKGEYKIKSKEKNEKSKKG